MQNIFITAFLFFISGIVSGQHFHGEAIYQFMTKKDSKQMQLFFNDTASMFVYDKIGLDTGNATRISMYADDAKGTMIRSSSYDSTGEIIYRNFNRKDLIIRETRQPPFDAFTIKDDWITINWIITNDYKIFSGIKCRKAVGAFRGRKYTAWFAPEIQVPYGPWKLFGLPGLIVAAYDKNKVFNISLTSLCYPCDSVHVIRQPKEDSSKTIREFVKFRDNKGQALVEKIRTRLPEGMSVSDFNRSTSIEEERDRSFEREYEWETAPASKPIKKDMDFDLRMD